MRHYPALHLDTKWSKGAVQHFTVTDGSSVMSITHTLRLGSICIRYKMECKNFIEKLGNCHAVYTDLVLVYF
jgi:hypothetical protein